MLVTRILTLLGLDIPAGACQLTPPLETVAGPVSVGTAMSRFGRGN